MSCQLRATGVHNIDNCGALGKSCQESSVAARAAEVLRGFPGLTTRARAGSDGGQSQWYVQIQLQGPAAGVCVVAQAICIYTHIVAKARPTLGTLAAVGTLAVSVLSFGFRVSGTQQWRLVTRL